MLVLKFVIFTYFLIINKSFGQFLECPLGWQKGDICGGIFCYFKLQVPPFQRQTAVENNICQTVHPSAHVVSIHCSQEMQFLVQYGKFVIGLHIRSNEPWTRTGFRWEDGSPLDFDGWDHQIPDQPDNQLAPERNVEFRNNLQRFGWHDLPLIFFEAVVCKITLRSYGLLPPNPYNPVNPSYPYPPNPYVPQQQTPQPRFGVATQVPGIPLSNPNPIQQQLAAPPAEVIIEQPEILVVNPGTAVVAATPSVIHVPPPVYQ